MAEVAGAGRQRRSGAGAGRIGADRFLYEMSWSEQQAWQEAAVGRPRSGRGLPHHAAHPVHSGTTTTSSGCRLSSRRSSRSGWLRPSPKWKVRGPGLGSKPWGGGGSQWTGTEGNSFLTLDSPPNQGQDVSLCFSYMWLLCI